MVAFSHVADALGLLPRTLATLVADEGSGRLTAFHFPLWRKARCSFRRRMTVPAAASILLIGA